MAYSLVHCPVCFKSIPPDDVDQHVDECLRREDNGEPHPAHDTMEDLDREFALRLMVEENEERQKREEDNNRLLQAFLQNDKGDVIPCEPSSYQCNMCSEKYLLEKFHFLDCSHSSCKICLRGMIINKIASKKVSQICCNECGKTLSTYDIKELLDEEEHSQYEAASMQEILDSNSTFKRCPNPECYSVLELMKSQPALGNNSEIGPDGAKLSLEALKHKQEFRFRCYKCNTAFCAGCNTSPYHLGYTCEQFKSFQQAKHCRFCNAQLTVKNTSKDKPVSPAFENLCNSPECNAKKDISCDKSLKCGHFCCGIKDEPQCLKCLQPKCLAPDSQQTGADFCNICWVSELGQAPCIQLACSHIFHLDCIKMKLKNRWAGTRITFGFLECALCKQMINHPALQEDLKPILELKEQVKNKALQRLRFVEGDKKVPELTDPHSKWFNNPEGYTMYRFAYFLCYKCKQPYYGGERACEEERGDFDPKELLCGGCSGVAGQEVCPTHGKDFIEYKCKFCCSMSVFFCWGTTHFCDSCHKRAGSIARVPREELPKCNCNVKHPQNGEEFCFGCAYCKILQTF